MYDVCPQVNRYSTRFESSLIYLNFGERICNRTSGPGQILAIMLTASLFDSLNGMFGAVELNINGKRELKVLVSYLYGQLVHDKVSLENKVN